MGRAGLNRKTALATLTLTLAAEAPDLDVIGAFRGPAFGFAHHRGFTHSFVGVPLDAAVEIEAKKAAGYFAPAGIPDPEELSGIRGRALDD